jgi:sulfur-oxidizing protein SoxB
MTGHWEFTLGADRVSRRQEFAGKIDFIAQNVKTADFGDWCFRDRTINGVPVAIVGRALSIHRSPTRASQWTFGIQDERCKGRRRSAPGKR